VPEADGQLTAVVVSGGKQYRVAPGQFVLVDRVAAEPGTELTLDRVLMVADGEDLRAGPKALDGVTVLVRVVRHSRGPKIDAFRYKSKKRVRVRHGARADLTALEILEIDGKGRAKPEPKAAAEPEKKPRRARAAKTQVAPEPEPAAEPEPEPEAKPAPKRTRTRKAAAGEG
jgi:large subunit ribosomal protein L21